MLKLVESLSKSADYPESCKAGANGWVRITFGLPGGPWQALLRRWLDESRRAAVGTSAAKPAKKRPNRR